MSRLARSSAEAFTGASFRRTGRVTSARRGRNRVPDRKRGASNSESKRKQDRRFRREARRAPF